MMRQTTEYGYAAHDGYQVVTLPYAGGALAMSILLPSGPLAPLQDRLTKTGLGPLLAGVTPTQVDLWLPRFTVRSGFSLNGALSALGMPEAFSDAADFAGITTTEPLTIQAVEHQAYVHVDEEGTEAAAATGVAMKLVSLRLTDQRVVVDRPFLFAITAVASGAPLFLGRVDDPRS
jgi:serpin B